MEGDYTSAKTREAKMKSNSAKRGRFPALNAWHLSRNKSNPTLLYKQTGVRVTIFPSANGFKFVVNHPQLQNGIFSPRIYNTTTEAKQFAFDALLMLADQITSLQREFAK